ncbi:MAG: NADPH-dependent assimilatory sulfite reductase hemoprotein subunit [Acidimicrobiales bacterium]
MAPSAVEQVKADSSHLRGDLAAELGDGTDHFGASSVNLLKFHGIYQQDDRDQRRARTSSGGQLAFSCMVRCSVPGGILRREQWAEIDRLADEVGDGSLRLTTRQGVQYHFIHKGGLKPLIGALNRRLVTTYAACGDVVRNVMFSSTPEAGRPLERVEALGRVLANRFKPRSEAYWELWLDGERAVSAGPPASVPEPIYGDTYLPRKFKIGVTWPGDNSIDVYTQDVGLVLVPGPDGADGAVVLAGGGLGRSASDPTTFPRLAEPLAWVPEPELPDVVEAIVTIFRDFGNRDDRSKARLKYLVEERGIGWLKAAVEGRLGRPLADPVALPPWGGARDHLGWHRMDDAANGEDDLWFLGLPVPTGRLNDGPAGGDSDGAGSPGPERRTAVRTILASLADHVRITPHQDLLLCGIRGADKAAVEEILARHRVPRAEHLPLAVLSSMACPALPTCAQALGEAERILPQLTELLDGLLRQRRLHEVRIETRVTGCPNGCARPYVAELGVVARTKRNYDVYVGGDAAGTRLAVPLVESVPLPKLDTVLAPLLDGYAATRKRGEGFGDWAVRTGIDTVGPTLPTFRRTPGEA